MIKLTKKQETRMIESQGLDPKKYKVYMSMSSKAMKAYELNPRRENAKQFFNDLILSLTKGKCKWTPTERMQFNRISAFFNEP